MKPANSISILGILLITAVLISGFIPGSLDTFKVLQTNQSDYHKFWRGKHAW